MDFVVSMNHWVKIKEKEKGDKYLDLAKELKIIKMTVILSVICALWTIPISWKSWKLEDELRLPNYSITKIGQNTEKSPGDLRRLTVA